MSKFILFAVIALAAVCQAYSCSDATIPMSENTLAHFILKSSRSLENNPQRTTNCFLEYLPKLNQLTEEYEQAYSSCMDTTANSKERVESEVLADRNKVQALGEEVCQRFSKCSDVTSSADYFDCYYNSAGGAITDSYEIQTTSKNKMQYIELRYQTIKYDEDVCTNACKAVYVEESAKVYNELDQCLAGVQVVPSY